MWIDPQGNLYLGDMRIGDRAATQPEIQAHQTALAQAAMPKVVTMRQARLALLQEGLLDDVEGIINSLPEPQKSAARIEWDYSSEVYRQQPLVLQLATGLSLNSEQLDNLFLEASLL